MSDDAVEILPTNEHGAKPEELATNACTQCGTTLPENARFCPSCGATVSSSILQSTSTPSSLEPAPVSTPTVQPVPAPPAVSYAPQPGTVSMPQPSYPQSLYPAFAPRPPKDRSIALILEILPGLFGFLGFGWLYSGNTGTGIAWLVGVLAWEIIAVIVDVVTGGGFCLCSVPVNLVLITISAYSLNKYTKLHPELFGA
jgi:TM2 domain-containing membrane protein YozV